MEQKNHALKKNTTNINNDKQCRVKICEKAGMAESWSSEHESAIFKVMISFGRKAKTYSSMVQEFEGKASLRSQRAAWQSYFKNHELNPVRQQKIWPMSRELWIVMNEIKINRQETKQKNNQTNINTISVCGNFSKKKHWKPFISNSQKSNLPIDLTARDTSKTSEIKDFKAFTCPSC